MQVALFGLAAAALGGALSLGGSFLATEQQRSLDELSAKRTAYATYVADAAVLRQRLMELTQAIRSGDQKQFAQGRADLVEAEVDLYTDGATVWLIADGELGSAALELNAAAFGQGSPLDVTDAEVTTFVERMEAMDAALVRFMDLARADIRSY